MDWFGPVDIYCERLGPGFWAEPANALSNLAFVIAGLWGLFRARRSGADTWIVLLCWWVVAIGTGSFIFHTFANHLAELADVVPIWSFVLVYVVFSMRRMFAMSWARIARSLAVATVVTVGAVSFFMGSNSGGFNGSVQYLPAITALILFAAALRATGRQGAGLAIAATLVFAASLVLRTVDPLVCADWPVGTHYLWHVFNAFMLALLLQLAILYRKAGYN